MAKLDVCRRLLACFKASDEEITYKGVVLAPRFSFLRQPGTCDSHHDVYGIRAKGGSDCGL